MKKSLFLFTTIILSVVLIGCSQNKETNADSSEEKEATAAEYANSELLVDTDWVEDNAENVTLIDTRREGYEGGHIPGAIPFSTSDLVDPDAEFDGVLLEAEGFAAKMQDIGVNQDETVVIYDDGSSLSAARLFYALEFYGHQDVKIYNGGFTEWLNAGKDTSTEAPELQTGDFVATANQEKMCDIETLQSSVDDENVVILDTRSEAEYTGEEVRAERGGHVPNAVHIEWSEAITEKDGVPTFKSAEELTALYEEKGVTKDKTIVPYCQTNVRGAHTYFTLRLLGYDSIKPYEGSWAEYGNVASTTIE
ncbi:rhodanese-like domain-containing protein [Thalassobacillus sp. B23F22_16]|uniref:rhodanese-like domain-containing protein n=1 Tax=Thalassobacillus sp. B23F22_16 TaxID=3459513 RepID=UPI00373E8B45